MPRFFNISRKLFSMRLLLALTALFCACFFLAGCENADSASTISQDTQIIEDDSNSNTPDIEEPNTEISVAEPSKTDSSTFQATSEPIVVTMENANNLFTGTRVQVSALVSLLRISYDNSNDTDFIINLTGERYNEYDIMGTIPIKYTQIISDYPDIYASYPQVGPDKRNYIMTAIGDFAGYRINPETNGVNGFDMKNCQMISLVPAEDL